MGPSILDREDGDTIAIDFDELYGLYDTDTPPLQPLPVDTQADLIDNSVWTSGNVIEDSLEAIRSVLSSANLPATNRNIIEKSLTTLRNAMELPAEAEALEPGPVAGGQEGLDSWPHQGVNQAEASCYAAVASAAEDEGRVLEALGISAQVRIFPPSSLRCKLSTFNHVIPCRNTRLTRTLSQWRQRTTYLSSMRTFTPTGRGNGWSRQTGSSHSG